MVEPQSGCQQSDQHDINKCFLYWVLPSRNVPIFHFSFMANTRRLEIPYGGRVVLFSI